MKSKPYFWLIVTLSLLLGLSLGHIENQKRQIDTLNKIKTARDLTLLVRHSHYDCSRIIRQQRLRFQIDQYRQALQELSNANLMESSARIDKHRVIEKKRRERRH